MRQEGAGLMGEPVNERPIEALRRRQQAAKEEARKVLESGGAPEASAEKRRIDTAALEREVRRSRAIRQKSSLARSVVVSLLCALAVAVVVTIYMFPALRLKGESMEPTLEAGELVLASKFGDCGLGDLMAFSYDNEVMVKRVIAKGGDTVTINAEGTVFVGGQPLDEPYVAEPALGECDIEFPYVVPDGKYFVLGDHRAVSVDSRHASIGTVSESQVIGRIAFRFWPLSRLGPVA